MGSGKSDIRNLTSHSLPLPLTLPYSHSLLPMRYILIPNKDLARSSASVY